MSISHRISLHKAALRRKMDAWELLGLLDHPPRLKPEHTRGAMYLGGYAVECKLKAALLEHFQLETLEELEDRLGETGERSSLRSARSHDFEYLFHFLPHARERLRQNTSKEADYQQCRQWRHLWRYEFRNPTPEDARQFLNAVDAVFLWLNNNV